MNIAAKTDPLPTPIEPTSRLLTAAEFQKLADVPPEVEWFANISNRHTRRAYENAVKDFMRFAGIRRPEEFRAVTRAHLIAWRDEPRFALSQDIVLGPSAHVQCQGKGRKVRSTPLRKETA